MFYLRVKGYIFIRVFLPAFTAENTAIDHFLAQSEHRHLITFHLALTVQYAASETYKEWYDNTVRNCTAGSKIKYYKPNMMCTCYMPGVIDFCHFIGTSDNRGDEQEHKKTLLQGKENNVLTHRMKLYALKEKAKSCKVGEKFKQPHATCNWCACIEDGVVTCDTEVCPVILED